jgi:hypothetical protein
MAGPGRVTLLGYENRSAGPVHCSVWLACQPVRRTANHLFCEHQWT